MCHISSTSKDGTEWRPLVSRERHQQLALRGGVMIVHTLKQECQIMKKISYIKRLNRHTSITIIENLIMIIIIRTYAQYKSTM